MKIFPFLIFALLPICLVAEQTPKTDDVEKTINYLLDYVGKSDVVLIRNGSEHKGKEAKAHLKSKYEHFKKEIKTPEDFIRLCATKSMVSDKPYMVRLKDGKEIPCADWLEKVLKDYRRSITNKGSVNKAQQRLITWIKHQAIISTGNSSITRTSLEKNRLANWFE
ncbi:MAG TPA: DUF5329 family protein [Flavobacterium sp.]|nr:DUF5329 family protein [Flavobacterium sp.]